MSDNTGFAAFLLWNALKLHFTTESYDYFRYNGKTNVTQQTFLNNKSKYQFYKLSRKYSYEDLKDFYVANFLVEDVNWVGDITGPDGEKNYKEWQKRNQSLTYLFEKDIIYLFDGNGDLLKVSGDYPRLLKELMKGNICIETVVIMNDMMRFLPIWKNKIDDDIIWPRYEMKLNKYTPFLHYDKEKFKKILKEKIKENAEA